MEMNSQVCDSTSITKHGFPLVSPWARARLSFNLFLKFFQMKFASQHIRSTKNKTCGLSSPFFFFCALLHVSASMNNLYQSKTFSLFKSAIFSLFYTSSLGYYLCVNMSAIINEPWFQTIIEWCWRFELIAKKSKRVLS